MLMLNGGGAGAWVELRSWLPRGWNRRVASRLGHPLPQKFLAQPHHRRRYSLHFNFSTPETPDSSTAFAIAMALRSRTILRATLTPFLYPRLASHYAPPVLHLVRRRNFTNTCARFESPVIVESAAVEPVVFESELAEEELVEENIFDSDIVDDPTLASTNNPNHPQHEFTMAPFTDLRPITISSGNGGHGCISFLREKFIAHGPANGGSGGCGGSVYIQAVYGETSLHKLGRTGTIKAGSGSNGRGSNLGGRRGDDVVIQVPVGTVVREISRSDPNDVDESEDVGHGDNEKWTHYPQAIEDNMRDPNFESAKYPTHHHKSASQLLKHTHPHRIYLDLDHPSPSPILLVPGSPGGLGNPHFVTPTMRRPKFATKGNKGAKMKLQLELKVLADVGLVGLPNAGKSSFLRAVSGRKARVGEWAFTTLTPNIGTVVMEDKDLPSPGAVPASAIGEEHLQPRFTIADIPGLIADAHMNKGLGHGFLRHVERARVLAFVLDLNRPDPVSDLEALWREVIAYEEGADNLEGEGMMAEMGGEYQGGEPQELNPELQEKLSRQGEEKSKRTQEYAEKEKLVTYTGIAHFTQPRAEEEEAAGETVRQREKMSTKPWFVIANKADMAGTEDKFWALKKHLEAMSAQQENGKQIGLIPISALRTEGVDKALDWMKGMLGF